VPLIDQLFETKGAAAFGGSQVWEAVVSALRGDDIYVVLPRYSNTLQWGPVLPSDLKATVGDRLAVALSDSGQAWAVGATGGSGGGEGGGNVDGGFPDSVYGGTPLVDGNGVNR
jgi:hypothetical protein